MNNEEFERKMAFIVEQQAQFAADIQQMRGVQEQLQATQLQTEDMWADWLTRHWKASAMYVNIKIDALVDSQIKLTESQTHTDENLRRLQS